MQGVVTGTDGAGRDQSQQREITAGPDPVWAHPVAAPPQELPAGPVLPLPPAPSPAGCQGRAGGSGCRARCPAGSRHSSQGWRARRIALL